MEKYLKHKDNGRIFPWSATLANKGKFVQCNKDGVVTAPTADSLDLGKALAEKDKKIAILESEVVSLNAYTQSLEARIAILTDPRKERTEELAALDRKDLLGVAKDAGIENAANKYRVGNEDKLIEEIIKIQFPDESSSSESGSEE